MGTISSFIYSQIFVSLPKPSDNYKGKTILVTGSNVGLGKEAARHFVRLGASTVILAVRSLDKGEAAKLDILKTTKVKGDVIKVWHLDMAKYQSVIDFAARCEKELGRLDIALLNAGVAHMGFEMAEQDESTITVNVVCTFLLALLLVPKLKATANETNSRTNLTITASEVHKWAKFPQKSAPIGGIFDKLNADNGKADMQDRYQVSKLLEVFVVRAMAERRSATQIPITINCVNPGLCHSELAREAGFHFTIMKFLLARSTEVGSRTLVHAASQGAETHGQYMSDCRIDMVATLVQSKEGYDLQNRVWDELAAKLEKIKPGVTRLL
ncbi:short-chain dehydrogenase/reductase-like protein [Lojkania enalia]|uniref:Short-chain dehydrogenase/reductase-like protein n=1 Tax=Lojkania enalia TaxID=147567 RepID=A0A9P4N116_9PLEO|nr:short-chain dehydrogenase/reductase-like protein [Didymosphaeria enalia]